MTTNTENNFIAATTQDLITLAISDTDMITNKVITASSGEGCPTELMRVGYKLSIALRSTYDNLRKANSLFLRKEVMNSSHIAGSHGAIIQARLERLGASGKYEVLVSKIYDNLAELDLIVNQLRSIDIDPLSYIR